MPIYDAAMRYKEEGVPLVIFGGKEYGTGSSRDWAAKGTMLLGVKAVIVESFERIHRSNLVGMGVLPLVFKAGTDRKSLGITGEETIDITGLETITPRMELSLVDPSPERDGGHGAGDLPDRYGRRGGVLSARRHSAVCAAGDGEGGLMGVEERDGKGCRDPAASSCCDHPAARAICGRCYGDGSCRVLTFLDICMMLSDICLIRRSDEHHDPRSAS